jgi:hypothetical protein
MPLAGTAATSNRPDQFNPDRIHLQVTRDPDGPGQAACREPLTERRAEPLPRRERRGRVQGLLPERIVGVAAHPRQEVPQMVAAVSTNATISCRCSF